MARGPGYTQPRGWTKTRTTILQRDDRRCYLCGTDATTVDHIVPVSQGGGHDHDNLAAICDPCHTVKSEAERRLGITRRRPRVTRQRPPEPHPGATGA